MDENDSAAVVSGGGSGLGEATTRALAKSGVRVSILDVNEGSANSVAGDIGGLAFACDISSTDGLEIAIDGAAEAHGPARIAINSAGIGTPAKIVGRDGPQNLEVFRRIIDINLVGTFNLLRPAGAGMQDLNPLDGGECGVIMNTEPVAALEGQIGQAGYGASKGGVAAMTLPAAREFARFGIRVLIIAPGIFDTPMLSGLSQEAQDSLGGSVPFPSRLGRPEEYAALAMDMVSNAMFNGEVVRLDGAIRMQSI